MAETTKKQRFEVGTRFVGNVNYVPMEVIGIHDPWKGCQYEGVFKPAPRAVIRNLLTGNTSTYGLSALEHCDVTILDDGAEILITRDGKAAGIVTGQSHRYCAGCQKDHPCYIVKWFNGKTTKPCMAGTYRNALGILQIK
jgi:hypothetical protein